jgi:peptidyl-prolyl cis-trans isomerase D
VILRAVSVTPGTIKTLDEVREEIRKRLFDARAKDALFELTGKLEDTLGTGATLEEAAAKLKLNLRKVTVAADGTDGNGTTVDGLPGGDFLQQVFAADVGNDPELIQSGDAAYYEFRVEGVTPSARKKFDEIRAQVLTDWRDQQTKTRLQALADKLVARGNGGEAMSAIASSLGVAPLTTDPLSRFGKTEVFAEGSVKAASDTASGKFFAGPVAFGKGLVVGKVTSIQFEAEPADAPLRRGYSQRLEQALVGDVAELLERGAMADAGAKVDERRFQAFHNNE